MAADEVNESPERTAGSEQGPATTETIEQTTQRIRSEFDSQPKKPRRKKRVRDAQGNLVDRETLGSSGSQANQAGSGSETGYRVDREIVERTVGAILSTVDMSVRRRVYHTTKLFHADESLASELAANSGLSKEEHSLMSELSGIIAEKHGLLTGYAPEMLLGLLLTEWSLRVAVVMRRLRLMAEELRKARNDATRAPTP